jgi:hypothetical protein
MDRFWIGSASSSATRYLVQPEVRGLEGLVARLAGMQPSARRMWIAQGRAPILVKFEGPLYEDGPTWRIELTGPRWEP